GGRGVVRWVGTFMVARVLFTTETPPAPIRTKPLPMRHHKQPTRESTTPTPRDESASQSA
ncbi:MAG: hypothetical protein M3Y76_09575, partial [Chloroflexota bacterium]|nr:hypothetical protein [Chloroflexota bacterium]